MAKISKRHEFNSGTKTLLAKRSGFQCAICQAVTVGPSAESVDSITNIGVAAHITAAAPGGSRYDESLTPSERSGIRSGIWLCQNHAKLIDSDQATWTVSKLHDIKSRHEAYITRSLGIPRDSVASLLDVQDYTQAPTITPKDYAFISVGSLVGPYKSVLDPMLRDRGLTEGSELGILMCGSANEEYGRRERETPWTAFVNADWLRWYLDAQRARYKTAQEVPSEQVYGLTPAWPDSFFEFLEAIVLSTTTFKWQRHRDRFLVLAQQK